MRLTPERMAPVPLREGLSRRNVPGVGHDDAFRGRVCVGSPRTMIRIIAGHDLAQGARIARTLNAPADS